MKPPRPHLARHVTAFTRSGLALIILTYLVACAATPQAIPAVSRAPQGSSTSALIVSFVRPRPHRGAYFESTQPNAYSILQTINSKLKTKFSAIIRHPTYTDSWTAVKVTPASLEVVRAELLNRSLHPEIKNVVPDAYLYLLDDPSPAPAVTNQWYLDKIEYAAAMKKIPDLRPVLVAIFDTGVQYDNPDLKKSIAVDPATSARMGFYEINGVQKTGDLAAADDEGHGTFVAGIVAAAEDATHGIHGIDSAAAILPIKVCSNGQCLLSDVADGVRYAVAHGARVINMSFGCRSTDSACLAGEPILGGELAAAKAAGALVVASSGNEFDEDPGIGIDYPASDPNAMAVGATNPDDSHAYFSNEGPQLSVVAPGINIFSVGMGNEVFRDDSGTSDAAPIVSGLAALLADAGRDSATRVQREIEEGASKELFDGPAFDEKGHSDIYGYGRVSALGAVQNYLKDVHP